MCGSENPVLRIGRGRSGPERVLQGVKPSMNNRIDALKQILEAQPHDNFARYGLAMEYMKAGRYNDAVEQFRALISRDPGYSYAYYHGGQALEKMGRVEEARQIYTQGIAAARDAHARSELQAALDLLP